MSKAEKALKAKCQALGDDMFAGFKTDPKIDMGVQVGKIVRELADIAGNEFHPAKEAAAKTDAAVKASEAALDARRAETSDQISQALRKLPVHRVLRPGHFYSVAKSVNGPMYLAYLPSISFEHDCHTLPRKIETGAAYHKQPPYQKLHIWRSNGQSEAVEKAYEAEMGKMPIEQGEDKDLQLIRRRLNLDKKKKTILIEADHVPRTWPKFVLEYKKDQQELYYQDRSTPIHVVPIYVTRSAEDEMSDGDDESWSYDDRRNDKGQVEANQRGSHVFYQTAEQRVLWDDKIKNKPRKEWLDELDFVYVDACDLKEVPLEEVNHMMRFAAFHKDIARDLRIHYGNAVRNGDYQNERIVLV